MNEEKLSAVLDNLLSLLLLEGSYEIEEKEDAFYVSIDTTEPGRLIGAGGETLQSLQSIVNQIVFKGNKESKRVLMDISGWRKQKEEDLKKQAERWAKEVLETKKEIELEPMSPWQRRIVHMVISESEGVETESIGEGRERHIVIRGKRQEARGKNENNSEEKPEKDAKTKKD